MKNFPHQINEISKLVDALEIIKDLGNHNLDTNDDEILGYELARRGVYNFRNLTTSLADRIALEKTKPAANQGARTAARDLRRFFSLLNFIDITQGNRLTLLGEEILLFGKSVGDEHVCDLWRDALLQIAVEDEYGNVSHPYSIMMRIIYSETNVETRKLALALEARDDSSSEFQRVINIARTMNWESCLMCSDTQIKNAVKILPSIAKQINDINVVNGIACLKRNIQTVTSYKGTAVRTRLVNSQNIATVPTNQDVENNDNTIDMTNAIIERQNRTVRHQHLVKYIAGILEQRGYVLHENPMDCLAVNPSQNSLLIEVKTLNGDVADEKKQVRLALGQLMYYEFFNTNFITGQNGIIKIAFFENKISQEHMDFLLKNNCVTFWLENGGLMGNLQLL